MCYLPTPGIALCQPSLRQLLTVHRPRLRQTAIDALIVGGDGLAGVQRLRSARQLRLGGCRMTDGYGGPTFTADNVYNRVELLRQGIDDAGA